MSEHELVLAAKAGDPEAFSGLVRLHQASLRCLVAMSMLPPDDVDDIVQDAFLDAYRHLDQFEPLCQFGPWLRVICRNRLLKFLRDRRVRRRRDLAAVDVLLAVPPEDLVVDGTQLRVDALRHCLSGLDGRQRDVLRCRFLEGMAVKDIANQLDTSANAISVLLFHLKDALRRCIDARERQDVGSPA